MTNPYDYGDNEWVTAFRHWRFMVEKGDPELSIERQLDLTAQSLKKIYEAFELAQKVKEIVILCGELRK